MIGARPILAKKPNVTAMRQEQVKAVNEVLDEGQVLLWKSTSNWSNKSQPKWERSVKTSKAQIVGTYETGSDIMRYVSKGTRVRFATMTPDFVAKTTPGSLLSGPGRGGLLFVSRKVPHPGIEARKFDVTAAKELQPKALRIGQAAMARVADVSGHRVK